MASEAKPDITFRLLRWIDRWREMNLSPPHGLVDDMTEAALTIDAVRRTAREIEEAAKSGPQAATEPPWGWAPQQPSERPEPPRAA